SAAAVPDSPDSPAPLHRPAAVPTCCPSCRLSIIAGPAESCGWSILTKRGHGTQNPAISPISIFLSHADYEVLDFMGGARPTGTSLGTAIIRLGNEFAL